MTTPSPQAHGKLGHSSYVAQVVVLAPSGRVGSGTLPPPLGSAPSEPPEHAATRPRARTEARSARAEEARGLGSAARVVRGASMRRAQATSVPPARARLDPQLQEMVLAAPSLQLDVPFEQGPEPFVNMHGQIELVEPLHESGGV